MDSPHWFLDVCRPPWVVFPDLDPSELAGHLRQGTTEVYFFDHWRPFWGALEREQRARYLEHWQASAEWRQALAFHFDDEPSLDTQADVRESEEHLARHRRERAARGPWWRKLFRSRQ